LRIAGLDRTWVFKGGRGLRAEGRSIKYPLRPFEIFGKMAFLKKNFGTSCYFSQI
jgi:hypothetical protein